MKTVRIIKLILFSLFGFLFAVVIWGIVQAVSIGNGFLFIPSHTPSATQTTTPTSTWTVSPIPSGTPDLNALKTEAVWSFQEQLMALTETSFAIATSTSTPDIAGIKTSAVGTMAAAQTREADSAAATLEYSVRANEKGYPEQRRGKDLKPMVKLSIGNTEFWIDKYEVSQKNYSICIEQSACLPVSQAISDEKLQMDNLPVTNVSWEQAAAYCKWAEKRLPNVSEWQTAASGTGDNRFPWGNENDLLKSTVSDQLTLGPEEVDSHAESASVQGIFHLLGNVWEWVDDEGSKSAVNVRLKLIAGGGWKTWRGELDSSLLGMMETAETADDVGFRCAMD